MNILCFGNYVLYKNTLFPRIQMHAGIAVNLVHAIEDKISVFPKYKDLQGSQTKISLINK